jgi:amino acid adenylation domain-containing protein
MQNIEDIYELSPLQQGIFFHSIYAPGSGLYVVQSCLTLTGEIDIPAFQNAWRQTIKRHPVLRTSFYWGKLEKPMQVVYRDADLSIQEHDWSDLSEADRQPRLEEFIKEDRARGFDLAKAPLMRLALIRTAPQSYRLVWTFHHILLDGWSSSHVLQDSARFYESACQGRREPVVPLSTYRDYILWLQRQDKARAEAYWRGVLAGFTVPTQLAIQREGTLADEAQVYGEESLSLSADATAQLRAFARQNQVTLNTLVQGAWALVLRCYSNEEDVVFGVTVTNRPAELPGIEEMTGLFINTLPARIRMPHGEAIVPWLQRIQAAQAEMRRYAYSSLTDVFGWGEIGRTQALFESIIVFESHRAEALVKKQSVSFRISESHSIERTNYPLTLVALPGEALTLAILFDHHFSASAVRLLLERLRVALRHLASATAQRIGSFGLLTETERQQILVTWNDRTMADASPSQLQSFFELQADNAPDAIAIVFGSQRVSYGELNRRANRLARHLLEEGVTPESKVPIYMDRHPDLIVALLSVLKAGAAYVPLDPKYPKERTLFVLDDAQARLVLSQSWYAEALRDCSVERICLVDVEANFASQSSENPPALATDRLLAYVIYTSGSTGRPKGVGIEHRSAVAFLEASAHLFAPEQMAGVVASTSICFDLSVFEIFAPLACGGTVVLVENALDIPITAHSENVTLINLVPSAMAEILKLGALAKTIRIVNLAGEPLRRQLVRKIYNAGNVDKVYNLYGPSEDTTYSTWAKIDREADDEPSIGRPVKGSQVYLLDDTLQPGPVGVPGEIYIGGAGLARCYINHPEATAEQFVPNLFSQRAGERLYKTGDIGHYRPNGEIEYLGRRDHQIKIRGFRIEMGEIEATLRRHPAIIDAVARVWEEGSDKRLVAYIVAKPDHPVTVSELHRFFGLKLPDYMTPSTFVQLDALPLTPNGKIDRKALPRPEALRPSLDTALVMPSTEMEESIAAIWRELLRVDTVGIHDSFFDLGGHSLLMVSAHNTLREKLQCDISLVDLFKHPTVGALAQFLAPGQCAAASATGEDPLERVRKGKQRLHEVRERQRAGNKAK